MINLIMSDLKHYIENIDEKFKSWYNFAATMAQSVDAHASVPQLTKDSSRCRSNVKNDGPKNIL